MLARWAIRDVISPISRCLLDTVISILYTEQIFALNLGKLLNVDAYQYPFASYHLSFRVECFLSSANFLLQYNGLSVGLLHFQGSARGRTRNRAQILGNVKRWGAKEKAKGL